MAKATKLTKSGEALHGIVKQVPMMVAAHLPGLMDDDMRIRIPLASIVATADHICDDPKCGCDEPGDRCRCNTNVLLATGQWVTIQAKHADVEKLLES